jgi:hypothetical protein
MALPYNPGTALVPRTWLPGGVAVPASDEATPGPAPETPNPGDVVVEGAGSPEANGVFVPTDTLNDRSRAFSPGGQSIYWTGTQWELADGATVLYRSFDAEVNPDPDSCPWEAVSGDAPAPTVTVF